MWLGGLKCAKERRQWTPTLGQFFAFLERRRKSPLQSRFAEGVLKISLDFDGTDGAVAVPAQMPDGLCFKKSVVDGIGLVPRRLLNCWSEELVLAVPQGAREMEIHYER